VSKITPIRHLQGESLYSSYNGDDITTTGIVTAVVRRGFFLQTPNKEWDRKGSDGIFVFAANIPVEKGMYIEVYGRCVDYIKHDTAKPVTQIVLDSFKPLPQNNGEVSPISFTQELLDINNIELAILLNSLEGMLVSIAKGQTFIAPSNLFGDYVLALDTPHKDSRNLRANNGGMLNSQKNPHRWMPGFRVSEYQYAQQLNVGATLSSSIEGPLNYRADSYQIALTSPFKIEGNAIERTISRLQPSAGSLTVMTLNCFNLDPKIEAASKVTNARSDIDDDVGDGRFHSLAKAVVNEANCPDIIALQEIQDNDGAELSDITKASKTYQLLIDQIKGLSGITYHWIDIEPELGEDGGQPGGNIRNGFLYNPKRVSADKNSSTVLGKEASCYEDSRKPLVCEFTEESSGKGITIVNIHLASKRHQSSIFAPENAGVDGKLAVRMEQARIIQNEVFKLAKKSCDYYITGDFNDTEHSKTLDILTEEIGINLVLSLPPEHRYDYNHRGQLQVLMHGIVPKTLFDEGRAEYEIIHGNELIGIVPGEDSDKPSDHAYVIAKIKMS
jgi:predicted extracellular nuclease